MRRTLFADGIGNNRNYRVHWPRALAAWTINWDTPIAAGVADLPIDAFTLASSPALKDAAASLRGLAGVKDRLITNCRRTGWGSCGLTRGRYSDNQRPKSGTLRT